MSKKVLLSVTAVALLAMTAFAGNYKYENWPSGDYTKVVTYQDKIPVLLDTVKVEIHIPYFVIIHPQLPVIKLEQVGSDGNERFHFRGCALGKDSKDKSLKPTVHANFKAELSTKITLTDNGKNIDTKDSKWTHGVDKSADPDPYHTDCGSWPKAKTLIINATEETVLDIWCDVTLLNLMAFHQCQTVHVADIDLYILAKQ
jgi:hypothetical protein